MDVRRSGGQPDDDFCLGAVDSANRAALDAQKKSRWGVCVLGAKISLGEAPLVCQLLSSSLANFGPTNNFVRGSVSFMKTTLDSYNGDTRDRKKPPLLRAPVIAFMPMAAEPSISR